MSATVIIPTTGNREVKKAIESVLAQSYPTDCYLICDGNEYYGKFKVIADEYMGNEHFKTCLLPTNVGSNGFYGHRIYAAFSHLVNTDYVLFLDQDNWLEPNHVQECVSTISENDLEWCYSLRNIYENESFICQDNCESLGKWQTYHGQNHIDTNCYCIKTEIAQKIASVWHGKWGQDRIYFYFLANNFKKFDCSGKYTVNYRVAGNSGSVTKEFFENGNKIMNERYDGVFPWTKRI